MARMGEFSRLTGVSSDGAFQFTAASLSASDLHRLTEEFIQRACGDDQEKRADVDRLAQMIVTNTT